MPVLHQTSRKRRHARPIAERRAAGVWDWRAWLRVWPAPHFRFQHGHGAEQICDVCSDACIGVSIAGQCPAGRVQLCHAGRVFRHRSGDVCGRVSDRAAGLQDRRYGGRASGVGHRPDQPYPLRSADCGHPVWRDRRDADCRDHFNGRYPDFQRFFDPDGRPVHQRYLCWAHAGKDRTKSAAGCHGAWPGGRTVGRLGAHRL